MHTLNVIVTSTTTLVGSIIRGVTKKSYNHASFAFDNDFMHMYSFARKHRHNPLSARFVRESLDIISHGKPIQVIVMNIEISDEEYEELYAYFNQLLHDRLAIYNFIGLATSYFGVARFYNERNFVCSTFVAYVLSEHGHLKLKRHFSLYRPEHIVSELAEYKKSEFIYCSTGKRAKKKEIVKK